MRRARSVGAGCSSVLRYDGIVVKPQDGTDRVRWPPVAGGKIAAIGTGDPGPGINGPFSGVGGAFRGRGSPFRGPGGPGQGINGRFRGISGLLRGMDGPFLGISDPLRGMDGPFLRVSAPSQGISGPFRGMNDRFRDVLAKTVRFGRFGRSGGDPRQSVCRIQGNCRCVPVLQERPLTFRCGADNLQRHCRNGSVLDDSCVQTERSVLNGRLYPRRRSGL